MSYLTTQDWRRPLRDFHLNQITDTDDELLNIASDTAEAMVRDYLSNYYDVDVIFAKNGSQRHATVVRWCLVIAVYLIYERVDDEQVPERVVKNYDDTLDHLEALAKGELNAVLPRLEDEDGDDKTKFRWGGSPRRSQP